MIQPIIFALSLIALISVASGLESNPIAKIDKYLSKKTVSYDPITNFLFLDEFYEAEKRGKLKFNSNKKLLETLENFLALKPLIISPKRKICNIQAVEKLTTFDESFRLSIRPFEHLFTVYCRIRDIYGDDCREEFYTIFDKKLDTMKDLDRLVAHRLHDLMELKFFPNGREQGEKEYSVNLMYGMIINKKDSDILDVHHIRNAYPESCGTEIENSDIYEKAVQKCWLDPCQQYVDQLSEVLSLGFGLKPVCYGYIDNAAARAQNYFEHWAQLRVCQALLSRGAPQLETDLKKKGSKLSNDGVSGSDAMVATMANR